MSRVATGICLTKPLSGTSEGARGAQRWGFIDLRLTSVLQVRPLLSIASTSLLLPRQVYGDRGNLVDYRNTCARTLQHSARGSRHHSGAVQKPVRDSG
jgi:hypothetical protein